MVRRPGLDGRSPGSQRRLGAFDLKVSSEEEELVA
jgi:hypothetical protein